MSARTKVLTWLQDQVNTIYDNLKKSEPGTDLYIISNASLPALQMATNALGTDIENTRFYYQTEINSIKKELETFRKESAGWLILKTNLDVFQRVLDILEKESPLMEE